jgi:hypothetical protein
MISYLNTSYPTIVYNDYIIDPSIMQKLIENTTKKRNIVYYSYHDNLNVYHKFIKEVTSNFLNLHGFKHNKDKWYMDVIRYNLDGDTKRVKSGLAWHCENDNYPDVITILMYIRIDKGIIDGNLRYKDKYNNKMIIKIKNGTTLIMDGNVPHKPQDPYGTGKRDLIIMSFEKQ